MTGFAAQPRANHVIDDEIFNLFPALRDMMGRHSGDLSGGQQRQLAIARAGDAAEAVDPRRAD